jgi:hypothetical protein
MFEGHGWHGPESDPLGLLADADQLFQYIENGKWTWSTSLKGRDASDSYRHCRKTCFLLSVCSIEDRGHEDSRAHETVRMRRAVVGHGSGRHEDPMPVGFLFRSQN